MQRFKERRLQVLALILAALLLASCSKSPPPDATEAAGRQSLYKNPVAMGMGFAEISDPMALRYRGEYFTYVTGTSCNLFHSEDLITWQSVGPVIGQGPFCWAPDVVYKNGIFYAYASTADPGETVRDIRVRLYTSKSVTGPFELLGDLTEPHTYDAHYFQDDDGKEYLYWTTECNISRVYPCNGNPTMVDTLVDMKKLGGRPATVALPFDWECKGRCIFEAASVLKRDSAYYLQYSGGAYENETYGAGFARNTVPMGPDGRDDRSWRKIDQILATVRNQVNGPGHSNWVKAPNGIDDWTIYHGRTGNNSGSGYGRWLRIDPVMWGRDRFWMPGAPTADQRRGPALPTFRDLFNTANQEGLSKEWTLSGGAWRIADREAQQTSANGEARALAPKPARDYLVETSIAFPERGGAAAGLVAYWADEKNHVRLLLDRAAHTLRAEATIDGAPQAILTSPLPADFNFAVYHELKAVKNGGQYQFFLDRRPVGAASLKLDGAGQTGLITRDAAASFDGFILTHAWEDFFHGPSSTWGAAAAGTPVSGKWEIKESALAQSLVGKGRQQIFKGNRDWKSYELTASMKVVDIGETLKSRLYGFYAAYWDDRNYVTVLIDADEDTLESFAVLNGRKQAAQKVDLLKQGVPAKELKLGEWHTLQVIKDGFKFSFILNGRLIQEREFRLSSGQPGLITEDVHVLFDSIRAVRWD